MIRCAVDVILFITLSSILVSSRALPLQHGRVTPEKSYEGFLDEPVSEDSLYRNNILSDYGWRKKAVLMTDLKRDQSHEGKDKEDKRNQRKHSFRGMIGKRFFDQQLPSQAESKMCMMEVVIGFLFGEDQSINEPEVKHVWTRCKDNANNRLLEN
ncbi:uncharacterized protein [Antedon mediterranea]|uniref:uncharacterized protein isoform X2 n=1 Tax=Antedon mediterranea TaxID=105859 RepID=UPI003AF7A889